MNRNNYTEPYCYDAAGIRHKTTYITSPPPAVSVPGRMLEAWEDEEVTTEEVLYIGHIIRTIVSATEPNQVAIVQCRINNAEGYVLKSMPDVQLAAFQKERTAAVGSLAGGKNYCRLPQ